MKDYEFRTDNLNGFNIECKVCRYYNLGHCEHSNFHKLDECIGEEYIIFGTKGTIEFLCTINKINEEEYLVKISPVKIDIN